MQGPLPPAVTTVRFASIQRAIADNRSRAAKAYSDPASLSQVSVAAPFVVDVAKGSSAALDQSQAIPEVLEGDERLMQPIADVSTTSALQTLTSELDLTPIVTERTLVNSKKTAAGVDTETAIQFFVSYNLTGIDIKKVSPHKANTRGFYNITTLKEMCRGMGLPYSASPQKADLVAMIRSFHVSNIVEIERRMQKKRETGDTIEDNLGDASLPSSEVMYDEPIASSSGAM